MFVSLKINLIVDALTLPYGQSNMSKEPSWILLNEVNSTTYFYCPISSNLSYQYTSCLNNNVPSPLSDPNTILANAASYYPRLVQISLTVTFDVRYFPSGASSIHLGFGLGGSNEQSSRDSGVIVSVNKNSAGGRTTTKSEVFRVNINTVEFYHKYYGNYTSSWTWFNNIYLKPEEYHNSYKNKLDVYARIDSLKILGLL